MIKPPSQLFTGWLVGWLVWILERSCTRMVGSLSVKSGFYIEFNVASLTHPTRYLCGCPFLYLIQTKNANAFSKNSN